MAMASSSASELQAAASRRKEASGAARRGRMADSRSKTASLACRDFSVKFSQYLQFEMPKIASRAWARPTHLTHLPCAGLRTPVGIDQIPFPLTARINNIPRMRLLKWKSCRFTHYR